MTWIWDSKTHQTIAKNALLNCSKSFQNLVELHLPFFVLGIEAPDNIFKDSTNHYFNCSPNQYGVHSGKVVEKIVKEIELIEKATNNPDEITIHPKIAPFLAGILDSPLKAFAFELGAVSHYIADLHQPLHTDGKYRFQDETTVHQILEADVRKNLENLKFDLKRRKKIERPFEHFEKEIYKINGFYDQIVENYYLSCGKVKPDRWQNSLPIIEKCLSRAAQNISNVYLSFESSTKLFAKQIRFEKLKAKINNLLSSNNFYQTRKYKSQSLLIKKTKSS